MGVLPRLSSVVIAVICMAALAGLMGGSTVWLVVAAVAAAVLVAGAAVIALQRPRVAEVRADDRCCQMQLPINEDDSVRDRY